MAKRKSDRPKAASESTVSFAQIAKDYSEAEAHFAKVEIEYNAAKSTVHALRATMLKHLGATAAAVAPGRRPASEGGRRGGLAGGGQPREGTLGAVIIDILSDGKARGPSEVYEALGKTSYKSDSEPKSLQTMINITLGKLAKNNLIARQGRGIYAKA